MDGEISKIYNAEFVLHVDCFLSKVRHAEVDGGVLTSTEDYPVLESMMWVQREKLFSRWKERVVVVTEDYLHCFRKGSAQLSHAGQLLFKVKNAGINKKCTRVSILQISLNDIQSVSLLDRCGYLTVVIEMEKTDILMVRRPENLCSIQGVSLGLIWVANKFSNIYILIIGFNTLGKLNSVLCI